MSEIKKNLKHSKSVKNKFKKIDLIKNLSKNRFS
jgi:hypothetical protein